jgi:hypothetical protein
MIKSLYGIPEEAEICTNGSKIFGNSECWPFIVKKMRELDRKCIYATVREAGHGWSAIATIDGQRINGYAWSCERFIRELGNWMNIPEGSIQKIISRS